MPTVPKTEYKGITYNLVPPHYRNNQHNTITVLVGKNGTGKSGILKTIAEESIAQKIGPKPQLIYYPPKKIIAISTGPFDRFPTSGNLDSEKYTYIGLKNSHRSSSISLIARATSAVLRNYFLNNKSSKIDLLFEKINLRPIISINWTSKLVKEIDSTIKSSEKPYNELIRSAKKIATANYSPSDTEIYLEIVSTLSAYITIDKMQNLIIEPIEDLVKIIDSISFLQKYGVEKIMPTTIVNFSNRSLGIPLSYSEFPFQMENVKEEIFNSILTLNYYELIVVNDIKITTINPDETISLRRASSGRQCLAVIMLGIAGTIDDDSIILIDEPEISLHPAWQEEFIENIQNCFNNYRGCHFIIATHSPQIVSRLSGNNCFVVDVEKNKIISNEGREMNSSDYHLAEIFRSPGIKNEYISKITVNLISKIKHYKSIDKHDLKTIEHILELKKLLSDDDPLNELILAASKMVKEFYKND